MKWTRVDNVPEQPLYVWTIQASTIQVRSNAIDINKTYRLGAYGGVITGTQNILPMYPNNALPKNDTIYVYGQHLPYGLFSWGDTRYRIPFIVWIWNVIVSDVNVIASVNHILQTVNVSAEAITDRNDIGVAYTHVNIRDSERDGYLAFTTDKIQRSRYVMLATLKRSQETNIRIFSKFVQPAIGHTFRLKLYPRSYVIQKPVLTAYIGKQGLDAIAMSRVMVTNQTTTESIKLYADILNPQTEKTIKLNVNLQEHIYRVAKLKTNLALKDVVRTTKLSIWLNKAIIERTAKLSTWIRAKNIERTFKITARPFSTIERTIKLSVHPHRSELEPVISYILTNLARHYHQGTIHVSSYLRNNVENRTLIKSSINQTIVKEWGIHTQIRQTLIRKGSISTQIRRTTESTRSHLIRLLKDKTKRQKVSVAAIREMTRQKAIVAGLLSHHKQYTRIYYLLDEINQRVKVLININHIRKEIEMVEFNVLPLVAERNLSMSPSAAPVVQQLDVLISTCQTWVLSYLNFVPDEIIQDLDVHISTCSHMVASMLQWHLHGGLVSNEGYGNEVIFDLGEVDPVGPIPPVPSRTWEGGYVEDPFKGVGYIPSGDSTGYGSPAAEQWVSNVKMWWDNASSPFTQPDE